MRRLRVTRLGLVTAALFAGSLAAQGKPLAPALASYVAVTVNGGKLPSRDKASDADGTVYIVEFDELVLALRAKGEFRASLRYRQTLATKGERSATADPIQSMTVYGRYEVVGPSLRFIPDPKRGGKGLQIMDGRWAPEGVIEVPFVYRNGAVTRTAVVKTRRDDSRF